MDDVKVEGSSATFHVAEYATDGRLLAYEALCAVVAG
jgi:hypothetical protein